LDWLKASTASDGDVSAASVLTVAHLARSARYRSQRLELNNAKAAADGVVTAIFSGGRLAHCPTTLPIAITIPITEVGWKPEDSEALIHQCIIVFAFVHAGVMGFDECHEYLSHCFGLSGIARRDEAIGWDTFYALRLAFKYYPLGTVVPPGPVDSACCDADAVDAAHEWAAQRMSDAADAVTQLFEDE
jgi:hypothetical protein